MTRVIVATGFIAILVASFALTDAIGIDNAAAQRTVVLLACFAVVGCFVTWWAWRSR